MGGGSIDYEKDLSDDSIRFLFSKGVLSRVFDFAVSEQIKGNISCVENNAVVTFC